MKIITGHRHAHEPQVLVLAENWSREWPLARPVPGVRFDWHRRHGAEVTHLAWAILHEVFSVKPDVKLCADFRRDIVEKLPYWGWSLTERAVREWASERAARQTQATEVPRGDAA